MISLITSRASFKIYIYIYIKKKVLGYSIPIREILGSKGFKRLAQCL